MSERYCCPWCGRWTRARWAVAQQNCPWCLVPRAMYGRALAADLEPGGGGTGSVFADLAGLARLNRRRSPARGYRFPAPALLP